ncbi:hypothetical protein DPMN_173689 [Dreissena polymorpha]|uniref:Uncharacterized protein n=1 Tax=Dreissena polymorpha TaxID=45954 RepID=A0A9D4E605_DREPO|nr:hypothetical protein DPMN_173689 [Dreissena polymorpha]
MMSISLLRGRGCDPSSCVSRSFRVVFWEHGAYNSAHRLIKDTTYWRRTGCLNCSNTRSVSEQGSELRGDQANIHNNIH